MSDGSAAPSSQPWRRGSPGSFSARRGTGRGGASAAGESSGRSNGGSRASTPRSTREKSKSKSPPPAPSIAPFSVSAEDAASRKQRFDGGPSQNKYMEMNAQRDKQRQDFIKRGLLPDPEKRTSLEDAMTVVPLCEDMCPEFEREQREYQNNVDPLERIPGTSRIDHTRAVKQYHRPAAGEEAPLPTDIRTPGALVRSLNYLFNELMLEHPFEVTHPFIRDRTRSIRAELTMIREQGSVAISLTERIARWHLLALGEMRGKVGFQEQQELEQLRKVLLTLNELYDHAKMAQPPVPTPNEGEFRAYGILTHLNDPDIIWSLELLPPNVFASPVVQTAIELHSLAQRPNEKRPEAATLNGWSRFFKHVAQPEVPYLFACVLSTSFTDIRISALFAMRRAYMPQHGPLALRQLTRILGCDDVKETAELCQACGLVVAHPNATEQGTVQLHRGADIKVGTVPKRASRRLVDAKRGDLTYQQIIDGSLSGGTRASELYPVTQTAPMPQTASQSPLVTPAVTPGLRASPAPPTVQPAFKTKDSLKRPIAPSAPSTTEKPASKLSAFAAPFSFSPAPPQQSQVPAQPPPQPTFALAESSSKPTPRKNAPPPVKLPTAAAFAAGGAPSSPIRPSVGSPVDRRRRTSRASQILSANARDQLLTTLTKRLASTIVDDGVQRSATVAAQDALRQRWREHAEQEDHHRDELVGRLAQRLSDGLFEHVTELSCASCAFEASHERILTSVVFQSWHTATVDTLSDKAQAQERRRRAAHVAREVGVGAVEEIDVEALEIDGLTLGSQDDIDASGGRRRDADLAQQLAEARTARQTLWEPGTFNELLSMHVAERRRLFFDKHDAEEWTALLATAVSGDTVGSWLDCKLGQFEDEGSATVPTLTWCEDEPLSTLDLEQVGVVFLQLPGPSASHNNYWDTQRGRLGELQAKLAHESLFNPTLIILDCLSDTMVPTKSGQDRDEAIIAALGAEAVAFYTDVNVVSFTLDDLGDALETCFTICELQLRVRDEKTRVPLSDFVAPVIDTWSRVLRPRLNAAMRSTTWHDHLYPFCSGALDILRRVAEKAESMGLSRSTSLTVPALTTEEVATCYDALQQYVSSAELASSRQMHALRAALASWPRPIDVRLVGVLFECLAAHVCAHATALEGYRGEIEAAVAGTKQEVEAEIRDMPLPILETRNSKVSHRKRKAVDSPPQTEAPVTKKPTADGSKPRDTLKDLSAAMLEARSMLEHHV